jgi:putative flippase GtrA
VIAIANTLIHWQLFFILRIAFELSQACSNLLACCAAASFTFYANALYTFPKAPTVGRYAAFMLCLGGISLAVGALGDRWQWPGVLTVSVFSLISLVVGFLISKWLVFRVRTSASG